MSASNHAESLILNWLLTTEAVTRPTDWFIGLFDGDPTDAGSSGTEVTTSVRVAGRVTVTFGASTGGDPAANTNAVNFGDAANAVPSVTHFGIFDAGSSGNLLLSGPLQGQPLAISAGQPVQFNIGDITVPID